jgi:hypothetical protein
MALLGRMGFLTALITVLCCLWILNRRSRENYIAIAELCRIPATTLSGSIKRQFSSFVQSFINPKNSSLHPILHGILVH